MTRQSNSKRRVLFVDDEESMRVTFPLVLQEKGFDVRVVATVPEALLEINSFHFDVLIADLNIDEPGDGFLVISAMRHLQPHCANFILTGYPALETALQAVRSQVDDYFVKPVDVEGFVSTINKKLEGRRAGFSKSGKKPLAKGPEKGRENKAQPAELMREREAPAPSLAGKAVKLVGQPSDRKEGKPNIRELTGSLLQLRDEERRKLARELHDSTGQLLAAVRIDLSLVQREAQSLSPTAAKATSEAVDLVEQVIKEVRTISHLLHPPLLDEAGLPAAVSWFVEGFAERSQIRVELEFSPPKFGRLPSELETAIFRIVQEGLTNVHRHSRSKVAKIRIGRSGNEVRVEVEDEGLGIDSEKLSELQKTGRLGVGIRGMRERVRQLGGAFEISSGGRGTLAVARLPIAETSRHPAREAADAVKAP